MDTSHRNNVSLCEDDDDIWYWGYSIFVPHIPNTRAYPYLICTFAGRKYLK